MNFIIPSETFNNQNRYYYVLFVTKLCSIEIVTKNQIIVFCKQNKIL